MKKRYILSALLSMFLLHVKSASRDSTGRKEYLKKTDIEVVYNHYLQDGNNSAVTGGKGTEKLTVYSPSVLYRHSMGNRSFSIKGGSDIISSASTDRIDFVKSSASLVDARTYANLQISRYFPKKRLTVACGSGFSIESDYFSLPLNFSLQRKSADKLWNTGFEMQMFFDDLRWGRLNPNYYSPQKLIYPVELRYNDWFQNKKRQSYTGKFSVSRVINKRNIVGVFPEIGVQNGLLSTPFHRVYFADSAVMVERLPDLRTKFSLGLKWNSFVGGRTALRNALDLYSDNFGIHSIAIENETAVKISSIWTLTGFMRLYTQSACRYFAPYREHRQEEDYFTSDYDLSSFYSFKPGISLRYAGGNSLGKHGMWNDLTLRYAYYHRSNGLHAHILSCVIALSHQKKKSR